MSAISGYPQQSGVTLEQLQQEASTPAEVRASVLAALADAGISIEEMSNPAEVQAAIESALEGLDLDAATPAQVLAAVEAALDNKDVPDRTDLEAVTTLVAQTKALVEALEVGGSGPSALPGEVRMFYGEIPESGWEQVQGVVDLPPGTVELLPQGFHAGMSVSGVIVGGSSCAAVEGGLVYVAAANAIYPGPLCSYDPATREWAGLVLMPVLSDGGPLVPLGDGRLMYLGGISYDEEWNTLANGSAYIYDIASNTWASAAPPPDVRGIHSAVLLPSGKVLTFGYSPEFARPALDEYDPSTNTWTTKNSEFTAEAACGCVLPSGKVLLVDGLMDVYRVYDPVADTISSEKEIPPGFYTVTAVVGTAAGALLYREFGVVAYDEATDTFTSLEGARPISRFATQRNTVRLPNVGVFCMSVAGDNFFAPDGSNYTAPPIRYARKL